MLKYLLFLFLAVAGCRPGHAAAPAPGYLDRGYRGGGLLVAGPGSTWSHLAPGQTLPIRLARLEAAEAEGQPGCAERAGSVHYAELRFLRVRPGCVRFRLAFRDAAGALGPARAWTLRPGDDLDLDGDGLPDLALRFPTRAIGAPCTVLSFVCDREHTALFALGPADCPGGRYPHGVSGTTPGGRLVFQSDALPAALEVAPGDAPEPGDALVDPATGRFGRIERAEPMHGRWCFRLAPPGSPFLFTQVFGAAHLRLSGSLADLARRFQAPGAPPPACAEVPDFLRLDLDQPLLDSECGQVDLQVEARMGAWIDLDADITWHGASVRLAMRLRGRLRLAVHSRVLRPWHLDFGPWTLADPCLGFAVDGIPVRFDLPVTAGLSMEAGSCGEALCGVCSEGCWRWAGTLAARWSWRGARVQAPAPTAQVEAACRPLAGEAFHLDGEGSIRPWLQATPRVGVAALVSGSCPGTLSLESRFTQDPDTGITHLQEDAQAALEAGLDLDLPLLGKTWSQRWPLRSWTLNLGARDLPGKVQATRSQSPFR